VLQLLRAFLLFSLQLVALLLLAFLLLPLLLVTLLLLLLLPLLLITLLLVACLLLPLLLITLLLVTLLLLPLLLITLLSVAFLLFPLLLITLLLVTLLLLTLPVSFLLFPLFLLLVGLPKAYLRGTYSQCKAKHKHACPSGLSSSAYPTKHELILQNFRHSRRLDIDGVVLISGRLRGRIADARRFITSQVLPCTQKDTFKPCQCT